MTRDKQNESGPRDTTMARLVAAALESRTAKPAGDTCPDTGLLAAYADHALNAEETARLENHFADCAHCQKILAVLTVSAGDPLTQREAAGLGQLAGKTAAPDESVAQTLEVEKPTARPRIVRPAQYRASWRWLVPAFGVAAAVAMWFALRPVPSSIAPETQIMAEKSAVPPPPGQQQQMAQAGVPPRPTAPAANSPAPALERERETRSLDGEAFSSAGNAPAEQKEGLRDEANNEAGRGEVTNEDKKSASSAPSEEAAARAVPAAPPAPGQQTQGATAGAPAIAAGNAGAVGGAGTATQSAALQAPAARQAPAPQPAQPTASQLSAENALKAVPMAGRNMAAMAKAAAASVVFGAPDRGVEWRIGSAGSIERSTDQGKTWQPQSSGVTSDLLAGVAVSEKIAWLVGRAGTILRTTDGEHWQRAATPGGAPAAGIAGNRVDAVASALDFSGIQASDALHAIVTSADGQRYATADGGLTWTPQP